MKIKKIFEKHNIRKKLLDYSDNSQIFVFEPNIYGFVSKNCRYKD